MSAETHSKEKKTSATRMRPIKSAIWGVTEAERERALGAFPPSRSESSPERGPGFDRILLALGLRAGHFPLTLDGRRISSHRNRVSVSPLGRTELDLREFDRLATGNRPRSSPSCGRRAAQENWRPTIRRFGNSKASTEKRRSCVCGRRRSSRALTGAPINRSVVK